MNDKNRTSSVAGRRLLGEQRDQVQIMPSEDSAKHTMTNEQIPLNDRIRLGQLQKYIKYDVFPWKMLIHILIVFAMSLQVLTQAGSTGAYSYNQLNLFNFIFVKGASLGDDDSNYNQQDINYIKFVYDIDNLRGHVQQSMVNYYGLNTTNSMESYFFTYENNPASSTYPVTVQYTYFNPHNIEILPAIDYFNATYIGPFTDGNDTALRNVVNIISSFSITYKLRQELPEEAPVQANCYLWTITQDFDIQQRGFFKVTIDTNREVCKTSYDKKWDNMIWIPYLNLVLSFLSLMLLVKYFHDTSIFYERMRRKYQSNQLFVQQRESKDLGDTSINRERAGSKNASRKMNYQELRRKNSEYMEKMVLVDPVGNSSMKNMIRPSIKGLNDISIMKRNIETQSMTMRRLGGNQEEQDVGNLAQLYKGDDDERVFQKKEEDLEVLTYDVDETILNGVNLQMNWDDMTFADKAKLFRYWSILDFFANIIQIVGCIFYLCKIYFGVRFSEYFIGVGCALAWFSLVQYLDYYREYSFIAKSLNTALPVIIRTSIGVLPMYIGACLFATAVFSNSNRFNDLSLTAMNLYCIINGDEMQDVFRDLTSVQVLVGLLFGVLYVFTGFSVVVNVFVALVGDAFGETKYKSRFEWLKQKKETPEEQKEAEKKDQDEGKVWESDGHGRAFSTASNYSISLSRVISKKEEEDFKKNQSIKILQKIINNEASRWKERKMSLSNQTRLQSVDSRKDSTAAFGLVNKTVSKDITSKKTLKFDRLNKKNKELRDRALAMLLMNCTKIFQTMEELQANYVKMQELGSSHVDYEVITYIENEKQAISDEIDTMLLQLRDLLQEINEI